ncbi:MAG TPA: hypothetical protein VF006_14840 [Longimicrobium sp.]
MKKLRLNPEDLRVEEFSTTRNGAANRGTVRGHDFSEPEMCMTYPAYECPITVYVGCHSMSGYAECICLPNNTDLSCAPAC